MDETARLQALNPYEVLDTLEEQAYDDLTRAAAELFGTPIALISLIDTDRQWFKSRVGVQAIETPRELAFCAHAIRCSANVMVVRDATQDARFAANPFVIGEPGIRFYAGAPLVTPSGDAIGTLCVIDTKVRDVDPKQLDTLQFLARQVIQTLEERRGALLAEVPKS